MDEYKPMKFVYANQIRCVKHDATHIYLSKDLENNTYRLRKVLASGAAWENASTKDDTVLAGEWVDGTFVVSEVNSQMFESPDVLCKTCGTRGSQGPEGYCMYCTWKGLDYLPPPTVPNESLNGLDMLRQTYE